ncbi:hypothetical protein [Neptunicoccus cionae]|uniref:hypothetical protein n=1 Tax=Neptunicoccus cionae TaxID=2035344 RepID=UPI000C76C2A8|nr:hypothetical protein [Amylibacter cionae]PLS23279.1 hypothetical protein C0U40_03880 [Amylibacter cionae]
MLAFILAHVANALMFVALLGASLVIGNDDTPKAPASVNAPEAQDSKALVPSDLSADSPIRQNTPVAPLLIEAQAVQIPAETAQGPAAESLADDDAVYGSSGDDMLWGSSDAETLSAKSDNDILLLGAEDQVEDAEHFAPALSNLETIEIAGFDPAEDQLQIEYDAITDPQSGAALPVELSVNLSKDGQSADIAINDMVVAKLAGVQGITPSHIQLVAR